MFNHKDTLRAPTWQLHLKGQKLWHLCPPSQNSVLETAGKHDFFNQNYESSPELFDELNGLQGCSQDVTKAGDLIYYPEDYWHQTLNLETPTVSIGSTMLTAASYHILYKELLHECSSDPGDKPPTSNVQYQQTADMNAYWHGDDKKSDSFRVFPPHALLCNALPTCLQNWETVFSDIV